MGVEDAFGNVTVIERNDQGVTTAVVGTYGARTEVEVNANGYLARITNPADESYEFSYTDHGLLTEATDPRHFASTYTYDAVSGLLMRTEDSAGGYLNFVREVSENSYKVIQTTAEGRVSAYQVNSLLTGEKQLVNSFCCCGTGSQHEVLVQPDGTMTTSLADGTVITETFGPDPRWGMLSPVSVDRVVTLPDGLTHESAFSREIVLADPGDLLSMRRQTDVTNINGQEYTLVFDGDNNSMTTTSPEGRQSVALLDDYGRLSRWQSNLASYAASYVYDSRGRLDTVTFGPGDAPAIDQVYDFDYDSRGYIERITDPSGQYAQFVYDSAGRLLSQADDTGREVLFEYDDAGNVVSVTPPGKPRTQPLVCGP